MMMKLVSKRKKVLICAILLLEKSNAQWQWDDYLRLWVSSDEVTCTSDAYCQQHVSFCAATNYSPLGKCFCGNAARQEEPNAWNYENVCIACAKAGTSSCSFSVTNYGVLNFGLASGATAALGMLDQQSVEACEARCLAPGETRAPTPAPTPPAIDRVASPLSAENENDNDAPSAEGATLSADPYVTTPDGERTQIWLPLDSWVPLLEAKHSALHVRAFGRPGTDRNEQWIDGVAITTSHTDGMNSRDFVVQIDLPRDRPIGGRRGNSLQIQEANQTAAATTTTVKSNMKSLDFIDVKLGDRFLNVVSQIPYEGPPGTNISVKLKKFDNKYIIGRQADAVLITTPDFVLVAYTSAAPKYEIEGEAHTYLHLDTKFLAFTNKRECHGIVPDLIFGRTIRPIDAITFLHRPSVADGAPLNPFSHFDSEADIEDSVLPFQSSVAASLLGSRRILRW